MREDQGKNWRHWLSRVGTLVVSGGLLYYFFRGVEWSAFWQATHEAALFPAGMGLVIPLAWFWLSDATFTVKSFQWIGKPVRFREYLVIKASAYLLTQINFLVATAGVFLYFMRKTGISFKEQTGLLYFRAVMAVFGTALALALMSLGLFLFQPERFSEARMEIWLPLILLVLLLLAESYLYWLRGDGVILRHLPLDFRSEFWSGFRKTRLSHWAWSWLYTAPPILANSLGLFVVARAFQIEVPFLYFFFSIPLVAIISALPVAFGGFGTTTAAWMAFFSPYGTPAHIAAATLFIPTGRLVLRSFLGLVFLPWAMKELSSLRAAP